MAFGDPYATLPELKSRLGIGDATDDGRLTAALIAASDGIEQCTGRQFNDSGSVSARVFHPDSWDLVTVDDFSTTAGLVVATDADGDGVFEDTWAATDYELRPLNGTRNGRPGWPYDQIAVAGYRRFPCTHRPWGRRARAALQVTAQWGWAQVPPQIKEASLIVASEIFKLKDAPFGVAGMGEWGMIRVRQNPIATAMISPYAQVLVA